MEIAVHRASWLFFAGGFKAFDALLLAVAVVPFGGRVDVAAVHADDRFFDQRIDARILHDRHVIGFGGVDEVPECARIVAGFVGQEGDAPVIVAFERPGHVQRQGRFLDQGRDRFFIGGTLGDMMGFVEHQDVPAFGELARDALFFVNGERRVRGRETGRAAAGIGFIGADANGVAMNQDAAEGGIGEGFLGLFLQRGAGHDPADALCERAEQLAGENHRQQALPAAGRHLRDDAAIAGLAGADAAGDFENLFLMSAEHR